MNAKARKLRFSGPAAGVIPARAAPSSPAARARMQSTRQTGTDCELRLRGALFRRGLRYRVNVRPLAGVRRLVDIVFPRQRLAVFVDGCFWHGCPKHGTWPKANAAFWRHKIAENRRRDADTDARLREAGWCVVRVWEHENMEAAARRIGQTLRRRKRAVARAVIRGSSSRRRRRS